MRPKKLICNRKRKFFNTEVKFSYSDVKIESIKPKKNATTMTTKMQQETPSQAVVITKENVAQTKRPDSHRNQWVQTEPREKTEEQQKVNFYFRWSSITQKRKIMTHPYLDNVKFLTF